jgi:hypothetical protein
MKHITSITALTLCIAATVAACGGGGSEATASPGSDNDTDAPAASGEFSGTAYLRTQVTGRVPGKDVGLLQLHARALIADCNRARQALYGSDPSPAIDPAVLASLDVNIEEKYFDNGTRAASYSSSQALVLSDMLRWIEESKVSPTNLPATPPDCAAHTLVPTESGTLWRDGLRYRLDTKKRTATASRTPDDFEPRTLAAPEEVANWQSEEVAGQHCKVGSIQTDLIGPGDCIWERFPVAQKYLNWPWVLRSEFTFGDSTGAKGIRTVTLEATSNRALPENRLRIPDGYTVIGP